jgi:hypothetical protein
MAQIVHRPAIFDDQERNPFGNVLCKQYPYLETQGESFYDPKDPVKDLFVAGCGFVVGVSVPRRSRSAPAFSPRGNRSIRYRERQRGGAALRMFRRAEQIRSDVPEDVSDNGEDNRVNNKLPNLLS